MVITLVSMPTHLLKWQVVRKLVGGCDLAGGGDHGEHAYTFAGLVGVASVVNDGGGGARCGDIPNQSLLDPIHIFAKVVRWQVRVKVVMLLFRAVVVKFDSDASVIYPTFSFG